MSLTCSSGLSLLCFPNLDAHRSMIHKSGNPNMKEVVTPIKSPASASHNVSWVKVLFLDAAPATVTFSVPDTTK